MKKENLRSSKEKNVVVMFQKLRQLRVKKAGAFVVSTSAQIYAWFEQQREDPNCLEIPG